MKLLHLFLMLLLFTMFASAQSEKQVYLETAYSTQIVQDKGHSPLQYRGDGLMLGLSRNSFNKAFLCSRSISYTKNKLFYGTDKGTNYDLNMANRTNVLAHYALLKKVQVQKFNLFVGGQVSGLLDYIAYNKNANNLIGYELSVTLDPAIHAQYALSDKVSLSFQGNIPLMGYSVRPEELGLFPLKNFGVDLWNILSDGSFVSLNNYFTLHTRTSLQFPVKQVPVVLFYDYSGGTNNSRERKAFSTNKIGVQIPLILKLKKQ